MSSAIIVQVENIFPFKQKPMIKEDGISTVYVGTSRKFGVSILVER